MPLLTVRFPVLDALGKNGFLWRYPGSSCGWLSGIELGDFEQRQRSTACFRPPHAPLLLAHSDNLIYGFLRLTRANRPSDLLAALVVNNLGGVPAQIPDPLG